MSNRNPGKVVIAGGGVAGSMAAAYLAAAFGERISVTLVDSPVDACGHEASLGDFGRFFDFLGLAEEDWMPACGATYKLAVRLQDFNRPGQHFYLPFEAAREAGGSALTEWWLRQRPSGRFDRDCFVAASLCDAGRGPRALDGAAAVPYGYHVDAGALVRVLAQYAVQRGVRRVDGEIVDVRLDARGGVECLVVEGHGEVEGDLFVDCTGERGVVLHRALKVPHLSYGDTLPNDRVVRLEAPADMKVRGVPPYTTVAAQRAGWIWTVPLFDRIGAGYAYGAEYSTAEDAERTLREYVGPEAAGVAAEHGALVAGRAAQAWKRNCVAVGAAAGRVEPLGDTGVSLVHYALEQLVRHMAEDDWDSRVREEYNAAVGRALDGAREFLTLHYQGAGRDDTQYWRDVKTRALPQEFVERWQGWRVLLSSVASGAPGASGTSGGWCGEPGPGLPAHAYSSVLIGTAGVLPRPPAASALLDEGGARREFAAVREAARGWVGVLPTPYEYIARMGAVVG